MDTETHLLKEDPSMPNNPALPVVVYRAVRDAEQITPELFERIFIDNGWCNTWRGGIFDYHHFHSNAHEVLGVARGSVIIRLGGESGFDLLLNPGDAVILPAGTGHKKIKAQEDLLIIGAYPKNRWNYDIRLDKGESFDIRERIESVPMPDTDPVEGNKGLLLQTWSSQ